MGPSIIIDDSNPAIQYLGGSWLQCFAPNITDIGQTGSPMFETLHMLPTANGTLTYSFNGTGISVFASNFAFDIDGNVTTKCLVDGRRSGPIGTNLTIQRGNNIELCTFGGLDVNKTHNFTLDVTFPAGQHQNETGPTGFLFDYFLISPPPSMSLERSNVLYTTYDTFIRSALLGNTWTGADVTGGGYAAGSSVAQFNISFTGVAAWWYGFRTDHSMPPNKSVRGTTYSVDDTTSVPFSALPYDAAFGFTTGGHANGFISGQMTNQLLFRTPEFQYGKHILKVFSPGSSDAGVNQLTLQSLVIQGTASNNSLPVQTTIIPSSPTSPPIFTLTPYNGPGSQINVGTLVGGIVGGIFSVVVILIAALCIISRRERAKRDKAVGLMNIDYPSLEPFPIEADQDDTVTVGPRKARDSQQDIVDPFVQELEAPPLTKWTRHLARQSGGGQPIASPSAAEDHLPQPDSEIDEHPGPHRQATLVDVASLSDSSLPEPPQAHDMNGDTADDPVEVSPLQEEDSGMRLAQQGSRETFVLVLPPMYTAH